MTASTMRPVAVKILGPDAAAAIQAPTASIEEDLNFAAELHHPNIVPLYDSEVDQGWLYSSCP